METKADSTDTPYQFTILVPLYNEEGNLPRLARELSDYLCRTPYRAKVLFVNDGSTDNSAKLLEQLCSEQPAFSYIHLKKNGGLSTALKAGIDQVKTKYTGYIDADLQTSPLDFDSLMVHADSYDLVIGVRAARKDGLVKNLSSKVANLIRRSITHDNVSDTGCPLKVLHTDMARKIQFFKGMHRFIPALVQLNGGKVKEIPVRHFKRLAGKSKYHLLNRLVGPTADLMAFSWMRKRHIRYEIEGQG